MFSESVSHNIPYCFHRWTLARGVKMHIAWRRAAPTSNSVISGTAPILHLFPPECSSYRMLRWSTEVIYYACSPEIRVLTNVCGRWGSAQSKVALLLSDPNEYHFWQKRKEGREEGRISLVSFVYFCLFDQVDLDFLVLKLSNNDYPLKDFNRYNKIERLLEFSEFSAFLS